MRWAPVRLPGGCFLTNACGTLNGASARTEVRLPSARLQAGAAARVLEGIEGEHIGRVGVVDAGHTLRSAPR